MATAEAKARRRAIAQERITDVTARLAETFGIEIPEEGAPIRDTDLAGTVALERQADLLEAILAAKPVTKATASRAKPATKGDK